MQLFAQKKQSETLSALNLQIDSLKSQLSDARRAWKKCSEQQNIFSVEMTEKLTRQEEASKKWQEKYIESQNNYQNLRDSLKKTIEASFLLQKVIADKALEQGSLANKAATLAQKLKDSLVDNYENRCYIYSKDKVVYIALNDSLLFGLSSNLSIQGKMLLEAILNQLLSVNDIHLNVKIFAKSDQKIQDFLSQASAKGKAILGMFINNKYPSDRIFLQMLDTEYTAFESFIPIIVEITFR
jgi:hypothetical protein